MFTAEELAAAPRHASYRDRLLSISGFQKSSWARWLASRQPAQLTAFTPEQLRDLIAARPGRSRPRRVPQLTQWEAFRALFRADWEPDRSDRRLHLFSAFATLLINLLFGLMLLWLTYLRFMVKTPEADDVAIQVQMIGQGAPKEEGGGTPVQQPEITTAQRGAQAEPAMDSAADNAPTSASLSQQTAQAASEPIAMHAPSMPDLQVTEVPPAPAPSPTPPVPVPPTPPVAVEVSKPTEAISAFQIPPPQPIQLPPDPVLQRPELQAQSIPTPPIPVPPAPTPAPVEVTVPKIETRAVAMPQLPTQQARQANLEQAVRSLPDIPAPAPAAAATGSTAAPSTAGSTTSGAKSQGTASTSSPLQGTATTTGAPRGLQGAGTGVQPIGKGVGTSTQALTGGAPTALKSDDWGASDRNALGQPKGAATGSRTGSPTGRAGAGLYNPDGSLRIDDRFVHTVKDPYKEGTWLRRPSKFEPTRFELYWKPNETLLAEILRAGRTFVRMPPQPGQSAQMICEIMTGKGMAPMFNCFGAPKNPKQEQPAIARPPPNVPFKSKYFDDQSALGEPMQDTPPPAPVPATTPPQPRP